MVYVLHCADYAGPYAGSFVPMLRAAAHEATRRGHESGFAFSDAARGRTWQEELEGLGEIHFVRAGHGRLPDTGPVVRRLARILRSHPGAGVLHTHFSTFDIPAALVGVGRRNAAVFWHEHTPLGAEPYTRLRNALRYRCVGGLADRILCVSPELRNDLRARGAPPGKLLDFPNAIDTEHYAPITDSERAAARAGFGLAPAARVVLHFGWSWHRKGGDVMLAATELLRSDRELVVLTVVGESATPDLADRLTRAPAVRIVPPKNESRDLYAAADVFLSCSRAEGMPFAVMEALACGLPVIGTALPIQRALLGDLPGAAVVPEEDPAAIAAAITSLLSMDSNARTAHARLARARIDPAYGLETWARRLVDLYESTSR